MKPEDFKNIIRGIVKEELQKQLPLLIPQVLAESLIKNSQTIPKPNSQPSSQRTYRPQGTGNVPTQVPPLASGVVSSAKKEPKKYSNNPLLNEILNETVVKIKPENSPYVGYSEKPMSTVSDKFNITDDTSDESIEFGELKESVSPETPLVSEIEPSTEEQAKVLNKINRDFRGLMKAIDQNRKVGGPSSMQFD